MDAVLLLAIEEIAKQSGFAEEYIKERGEYMASSGIGAFFGGRDYNGHSIQDELWGIQRQVIEDIAEKEPCVIVGRCADYILKDKAELLTVFIHSSMESRAARIVNVYGETDEAAFSLHENSGINPRQVLRTCVIFSSCRDHSLLLVYRDPSIFAGYR